MAAAFTAPVLLPPTCRRTAHGQHTTPRMEAAPSTPAPPRKRGVRVPAYKKLQERQDSLATQALEARKAAEAAARRRYERRRARRGDGMPLEALHVGAEVNGVVNNLVRHGAYVDIGATRDGLVHVRDMGVHFVHQPTDVVRRGDLVTVWVKYVNVETNTLGLTMRRPVVKTHKARRKVADFTRGARLHGVVERITNFGAYIDIGASCPAFLHVRNLWGRRPRDTLDSFTLGRDIWVVVTDVDEVRNYIAVSARGCNLLPIDEHGNVVLDAPARKPSEPAQEDLQITADFVLERPGDAQDAATVSRNVRGATEQAMHMLAQKSRDEMLLNEYGMVTQTEEWDDIRHMFDGNTDFVSDASDAEDEEVDEPQGKEAGNELGSRGDA